MVDKWMTFLACLLVGVAEATTTFSYYATDGGIVLSGISGACPANLVIPAEYEGCKVIGVASKFLEDSMAVRTVTISEGVKSIGRRAFSGCGNLSRIDLPSTVKEVETAAFSVQGKIALAGSSKLREIKVSSGNVRFYVSSGVLIDRDAQTAIAAVRNLSSANLPDAVAVIGERCFSGCPNLKEVICGSALESIEHEAFLFCRMLKSVNLSETKIRVVAMKAFSGCDSLSQVEFPASLEELSVHSFRWCNSLIKVVMHGNAPAITSWRQDEWGAANQYPYVTSNANLDNFQWDGNAYLQGGRPLTNVVTYVEPGSTGWGIVPGTWQKCPVRYIGDEPHSEVKYGPYMPGEKVAVTVDALVGYTAKGLPKGLKFDKKIGEISGTPTKPTGDAGVTVTFTKKGAETLKATFIVSDWPQVSVSCDGLANGKFTVGVAGDGEAIPFEIEPLSAVKSVKASKLPSGMKLVKDKTTGEWSITGSPTKAGTYNVVLTVTTTYGSMQTLTIPVTVEALPSWVVGTWEVYDYDAQEGSRDIGRTILTITAKGKTSAMHFNCSDPRIKSRKMSPPSLVMGDDGEYILEWIDDGHADVCVVLTICSIGERTFGIIDACSSYRDHNGGSGYGIIGGAQNAWKTFTGTPMAPTFEKNAVTTIDLSDFGEGGVCDGRLTDCSLTLKYGKKGAVTVAFFEAGATKASATCSAQLTPYGYDADRQVVKAFVTPMLSPKGRHSVGIVLFLEIDVSHGSAVSGEGVKVVDYLLEDN